MFNEKMTTDGGPAFPCEGGGDSGLYPDPGMSLRDWFAGQVAPALIAELYARAQVPFETSVFTMASAAAYEFADAMIAARKEGC